MGRITIFSADGCPHSKRVKNELKVYSLPFTEISVTEYPEKRKDMMALSTRISTPQVFFNTRFVGDADETIELLTEWDRDKSRASSPLERYNNEIGRQGDPDSPRFAIPEGPPVVVEQRPSRGDAQFSVALPNGDLKSVLTVVETLKKILPIRDRKYNLTLYKNSFTGEQAVTALMDHYGIGEEDAITFGKRLQEQVLLGHVVGEHTFGKTDKKFRLTCHQSPEVLNSYRVWTEDVDPNSMRLLNALIDLMGKLETSMTDNDGLMDYMNASKNPVMPVFDEAVCELQKVDLSVMDETTKNAFGINLYNLFIKYAFIKVGAPTDSVGRNQFYSGVKFSVGGYMFSFNDWEHGILRGNRKVPFSLRNPFKKSDPRLQFTVQSPDCRIHFALNCGARSCPPVRDFSVEHFQDEMQIVALSFCEDDDNVALDPKKRQVRLSKILSWYMSDFVSSKSELPRKIVDYLKGVKKQTLDRMLEGDGRIKVEFLKYDWSTNSKEDANLVFDGSILKANERRLFSSSEKE